MSNILERHLEQNIEPNTSKESYIDKAIQIFQDMKEEDIVKIAVYKDSNKYCLCGLVSRMTGWKSYIDSGSLSSDIVSKLGDNSQYDLSLIHIKYCRKMISFEQMRHQAIQYMESLK